jgi:hypothetical protein
MDIHNDLSMAHKGKLSLHLSTRSNISVQEMPVRLLFVYLTISFISINMYIILIIIVVVFIRN